MGEAGADTDQPSAPRTRPNSRGAAGHRGGDSGEDTLTDHGLHQCGLVRMMVLKGPRGKMLNNDQVTQKLSGQLNSAGAGESPTPTAQRGPGEGDVASVEHHQPLSPQGVPGDTHLVPVCPGDALSWKVVLLQLENSRSDQSPSAAPGAQGSACTAPACLGKGGPVLG